ncbi:MAG TPA: M55 family metallopeptidase [Gemmatimonadaceae bacterium]
MRRFAKSLSLAVISGLWGLATFGSAHAQKLKVYISVDMEGIAGVVSDQQLSPTGFEYARFREFMTAEALAAINGAKEAGATEIVVSDSHGNMQNLLIERFPADVQIVRSSPRPLSMMQGIDSTFDAAIFIGYHSGTANPQGVRAHTMSSARYAGIDINGSPAAESRVNAAIAGYYGVPVVLITGDDIATAELKSVLGDVETAVVKRAIGFHSAITSTPEAAQNLIKERTKAALQRRASFKPYKVANPVRLDVTFKSYRPAEILAYLPIVERTTSHAIRYNGRNIIDVMRFMVFVGAYTVELDP